jgi:hypothetical protein
MPEQTIERSKYDDGYSVYEWGVYPRSSVLAGQDRKQWIDGFDTLEEAQAAYPDADVGFRSAHNTFDHLEDEDGNTGPSPYDMEYGTHPLQQDWRCSLFISRTEKSLKLAQTIKSVMQMQKLMR